MGVDHGECLAIAYGITKRRMYTGFRAICAWKGALAGVFLIIAAVVVWMTGHGAADVLVALLMGGLAVHSGVKVIGLARQELASENR
jgi:Co/Zn/Cd efflux system component